jgi:hypothetical protein
VASEKYASGVEWEEDESTIISERVRAWRFEDLYFVCSGVWEYIAVFPTSVRK